MKPEIHSDYFELTKREYSWEYKITATGECLLQSTEVTDFLYQLKVVHDINKVKSELASYYDKKSKLTGIRYIYNL